MSEPSNSEKLQQLRASLQQASVDYFVIPRADEFQGEYVPAACERLAWATGFTGSAGFAVVGRDNAALFVDGRYTLQVRAETNADEWQYCDLGPRALVHWLATHLKAGETVGLDPWLHTIDQVAAVKKLCDSKGANYYAFDKNPVDQIWFDRPSLPQTPVQDYPVALAGMTREIKLKKLRDHLYQEGADATLLSAPDAVAWLLNCRAGDLEFMPVALAYALVDTQSVQLFVEPSRLSDTLTAAFEGTVQCHPASSLSDVLSHYAGKTIALDASTASEALCQQVVSSQATPLVRNEPIALWKACKTPEEQIGITQAHVTDAVALCQFLCWLDKQVDENAVLDELKASQQLEAFRKQSPDYVCPSFETISAFGPNGAHCHYRVDEKSNRTFQRGSLYLVDSGGQYQAGTTDVTRTLPIGEPSAEMKRHFTRVLQGHIALATARFPKGTTGSALDAFARRPLWQEGLDYDHGTGHGVGCFLGVHEGPQRISKVGNNVALQAGMVVSNEPGYYQEGDYGIRIENLECVVADPQPEDTRDMLRFSALTLAPIDQRLIDAALLSVEECEWLDAYHQRVYQTLESLLPADVVEWLKGKTASIKVAQA